ncbi:MAG TPA: DUF6134 family protein [Woeseiaceae bacterium]
MMQIYRLLFVLLCLLPGVSMAGNGATRTWQFEVSLDGSPIGFHRFELVESGDAHQLQSEASFDVRFLFFNAFRYRHTNTEIWSDGCLRSIRSTTDANGQDERVSGMRVDDRLLIRAVDGETSLDGCVMTFAYWNPEFLRQPRLLNPQTGEYLPVRVESLGEQRISVKGQAVEAHAYRLLAEELELIVWYSEANEWLGLQSVAKGGRILRYELT